MGSEGRLGIFGLWSFKGFGIRGILAVFFKALMTLGCKGGQISELCCHFETLPGSKKWVWGFGIWSLLGVQLLD